MFGIGTVDKSFGGLTPMEIAKKNGITTLIIGHVTKEGAIAGPRVLEHMVDTVLYLEGERFFSYRILRAVKNRFGSTNEIGMFEMQSEGLVEIKNPSELLISERDGNPAGSVIVVSLEGTRALILEMQALSTQTVFGMPRRNANGIDYIYEVLEIEILKPTDVSKMIDNDFDLTLYTCTSDGLNRITVRCNQINNKI